MLDLNQFVNSANQPTEVIFSNLLWRGGMYQTNADWLKIDITKHRWRKQDIVKELLMLLLN